MLKINNSTKLIASIALPFVAGTIGSLATFPNISTWYSGLAKPGFNPPNWIFGPVWTTLYILMGISLYVFWTKAYKGSKRSGMLLFALQLALNALWSLVFFGMHWLWGGVAVIVLLLLAIAMTARAFWPVSQVATLLLVPYILWVSFATVLNIAVALMN